MSIYFILKVKFFYMLILSWICVSVLTYTFDLLKFLKLEWNSGISPFPLLFFLFFPPSDLSGEDVILQFGEEGSVTELGGGGFRISFSWMSSITYAVNNFIVNTEIFIHNHKGRLHSF